jgi:hypothetical protein
MGSTKLAHSCGWVDTDMVMPVDSLDMLIFLGFSMGKMMIRNANHQLLEVVGKYG